MQNKTVTIYQPRYFPQLHYFHRAAHADVFVMLDLAQYTKNLVVFTKEGEKREKSYQSDTVIKLPHGQHDLTIPVKHEGLLPLNKTSVDYSHKWITKHLEIIKFAYKKSANFQTLYPQIESLLKTKYDSLAALNIATFAWAFSTLLEVKGVSYSIKELNKVLQTTKYSIRLKEAVLSSNMKLKRPDGLQKGTEWTTQICKSLQAKEYYHGATAKAGYMNLKYYKKHGIAPVLQNWHIPFYKQQFVKTQPFISNLSILDLLFNESCQSARNILEIQAKEERKEEKYPYAQGETFQRSGGFSFLDYSFDAGRRRK